MSFTHAVICPGHAVYVGGDILNDASWALAPYQAGEPGFYIAHLHAAVSLVAHDPTAVLVLSGGATREKAGPLSEAQSYWNAAGVLDWFGHPDVKDRCILEEFACDSFQNLLFGICRFKECFGDHPSRVTMTGWIFKRRRFELHCAAIGWPLERFRYVGANDPSGLAGALAGEWETVDAFRKDPRGEGPELRGKRELRNPFRRYHDYVPGTIAKAHLEAGTQCSRDFQT